MRELLWLATGAWDQTAAVLEFIAAHGGVQKPDRQKRNPYRNRERAKGGWAELFAAGRARVAEKQQRESMNGSR